jgi:hypothetical protein
MEVFEKVNWDTIDDKKIVGSYVPLPDGRKQYVELSMLCWYWLDFCEKHADMPVSEFVEDTIKTLNEVGIPAEEWDESFQLGMTVVIMTFAKGWVRDTTGEIPLPLFSELENKAAE